MLRQQNHAQAPKKVAWKTFTNQISTVLSWASDSQNQGAGLSAVAQVQPSALMPIMQSADINNVDLSSCGNMASGNQHLMVLLHMMRLSDPESHRHPQQDSIRQPDTAALPHHDCIESHESDVTLHSHAKFLARALVLLKLISLSSSVDSGDRAVEEDLWWILVLATHATEEGAYADLSSGLRSMQTCDNPSLEMLPWWSDLAQLLVQLQRQISKASAVCTQNIIELDTCWKLQRMLMAFNHQAVAAEIISQGKEI